MTPRGGRAKRTLIGLACFTLAACSSPRSPTFARDSATVDSIARLVPTDSLFHLRRAMLTPKNFDVAAQAVECERLRLEYRYGIYPVSLAVRRMQDTLWKSFHPETVLAHMARWPEMASVIIDPRACGIPLDSVMPEGPEVDLDAFDRHD